MYIAHAYRDPVTKKRGKRTLEALGSLEDLQKIHTDPIAHFKAVIEERKQNENPAKNVTICLDLEETPPEHRKNVKKNIGYAALAKV